VRPNIPQAVRHLIEEYRRFLRTTYRFLDPHLRQQFEGHLAQADVVVRGPYVTLARDFQRGSSLRQLAEAGQIDADLLKANWPFGGERLYRHQERGFAAGREGRSFVVTTGTGSGKTEAFLLPVLDGILRRKREGIAGVQAVFLYPMNALANDQVERLRRLLRRTGLDISFALYTGDSDAATQNLREEPAETERLSRAATRQRPPDILLTNYKQLEFLLVRSEDRILFTPALKYLVLDEIHAYRGALATEIACLIRRLKAHAQFSPGELIGIGTSATVSSGETGAQALAEFATVLFGERFRSEDIIGEALEPNPVTTASWVPPAPDLDDQELFGLDPNDEAAVIALAERLTGRRCPPQGHIAKRVAAVLAANAVVEALEDIFREPASVSEAGEALRERFQDRAARSLEAVRREIEAYLLVGSVGDEERPPRLRPKLHTFFHGVYDVALCLNPDCRALVPQGGTECAKCGSAARPAALCRTCGQDFVKVRFEREGDDLPVGTGDFYSDERTGFLTHRVHELPEAPAAGDDEAAAEEPPSARERGRRRDKAEGRLDVTGLCPGCGRLLPEEGMCPTCNRKAIRALLHRGRLHTCPACGDVYTRGDIVTPLRTGTASTASVLATHHLDHLEGEDRKLLLFADNRQDVAHQAGYTADKHRSFALRHLVVHEVKKAGGRGVYVQELPERLFDHYRELGIVSRRPTRPERERWLDAFTYEVANEFTRFSGQRASLENLGLVAVEYEFLDELERDKTFQEAARQAGLEGPIALTLVRAMLDIMRKNRAAAWDFFQEYIDPNRKRRYRELEADPYNVRFPERDRMPKAFALDRPDHIRKVGRLMGFYQENPQAGQLTAIQKIASRVIGDRERSETFIHSVVPILQRLEVLVAVPNFPIPRAERVPGLRALQINPKILRLVEPAQGFRCNACQTWRPYALPTCPTPKCGQGSLQASSLDKDNYYVRLYLDRPPRRLAVAEHSAQIPGEDRAKRETAFKDGRLEMLVCTPTLELGVDIGPLLTVALRNAPPTPANYAQRVGRAGRRLRIGFVSTFCAGGAHDRNAFENPAWLVAGRFDPPRVRLDNPHIVHRHLRSFLLEGAAAQVPVWMGDFLDDLRVPTRWKKECLDPLFEEIQQRQSFFVQRLASLFAEDRDAGRTDRYGIKEDETIIERFPSDLTKVLEGWWQRVAQLDREFREYSTVGSPRQDEKKAAARKRAYHEITQDRERAYTLNYLSTQGLLPAYQFPVHTFSLDPGVADTPTLYRPSAIAIEEFAPGNFVYANGHKLRSIRVLFAGGPGSKEGRVGRTDAETSGRLQSFYFCDRCDEVAEETRNTCERCGTALPAAVDVVFVNAFEAEESLRIGSDEESRQRQYHVRRESLLAPQGGQSLLYPYPLAPVEYWKLAEILVTNWGRADSKTGDSVRFWLCPDCGRHQPNDPANAAHARPIQTWREHHARYCRGEPASLVLAYRFQTDCLVLTVPTREDATRIGRWTFSPTLVTLAEALLAGAGNLLELEPYELNAFVRPAPEGTVEEQIIFYETVPGGAGYVEEMARRLADVAEAASRRLYGHRCSKACYLCLKHYRNQRWHAFFDKDRVRDLILTLGKCDPVEPFETLSGASVQTLQQMLVERREEAGTGAIQDPPTGRYRKGAIEEPLRQALERIPDVPPGSRNLEIRDGDRLVTVPDFAWEDVNVAVYCDGFAIHGNRETLELDARKRNLLQSRGWVVLTFWGRTILRDPDACANQIAQVYRARARFA
jgi:ATP-dependent helicase YprA (DUF1998 family)